MANFILIILVLLMTSLYVTYEVVAIRTALSFLEGIYVVLDSMFNGLGNLTASIFGNAPVYLRNTILFIIIMILFIIIWKIIFAIIHLIRKNVRKNKIKKALGENAIELTEEEMNQYDYKLYENKFRFPTIRFIIMLVEILLFAVFLIIRFDVIYIVPGGIVNEGDLLLFYDVSNGNAPFIVDDATQSFTSRFYIFHNAINGLRVEFMYFFATLVGHYIQFANGLLHGLGAQGEIIVEIIIIVFILLVLILITFLLGLPFSKSIRKHRAKKYAKKKKEKYIKQLEDKEYKTWKQGLKKGDVSKKNEDLYVEEPIENIDITPIVVETKTEETEVKTNQTAEQNYIDDISTGVTDLGLVEEDDNELQTPLTTRETRFVGDEESDIILEEEPIIETIEEEEAYYNEASEETEESFEKYQPETVKDLELEDKVKKYNIDVIDEAEEVEPYKEETPAIEEFEDREIAFTTNVIEEPVKEETIEEVKVEDPVEAEEKPKKPTKPIEVTKKTTKTKGKITPVDAVDEQGKSSDYILETSDGSQLAMTEEELKEIAVKTEKKPRKKASALTRNVTAKGTSTRKKKTTTKGTTTKKTSGTKKTTTPKEKTIKKPTKPVSAKSKE